jgi:hypothetical protein
MKKHQLNLFADKKKDHGTTSKRRETAIELIGQKLKPHAVQKKLHAKYGMGVSTDWLYKFARNKVKVPVIREAKTPRTLSFKLKPKIQEDSLTTILKNAKQCGVKEIVLKNGIIVKF